MSEKGKVFLVGAGPGEPKLSTLRAKELIEQCDVLVYDNLANPELRKWRKSECLEVDVGKSPGRHTVEQREIEKTLIQHAFGKNGGSVEGGRSFRVWKMCGGNARFGRCGNCL